MKKIIINTKYLTQDYRNTINEGGIRLHGNTYDYVLVLLTVFYVIGFLILMSS